MAIGSNDFLVQRSEKSNHRSQSEVVGAEKRMKIFLVIHDFSGK
jgi:hypothetical protein